MSGGKTESNATGVLYVVATPIGNLGDITLRALEILARVGLIAAEDTRHTGRLLAHYGISTRLLSCHEHNEEQVAPRLLKRLAAGQEIALVSDAGTPLISDPGYRLVSSARSAGYRVVPVPGASAVICALSASGMPSDRFLFLGFPPRARAKRLECLASVASEPGTLVFHETGNRVAATLDDMATTLGGGRRALVARELTKRFETFLDGTLETLRARIAQDPEQTKGELVLLVEGDRADAHRESEGERVVRILARELPVKRAAALAAEITGARKNRLYRVALQSAGPRFTDQDT